MASSVKHWLCKYKDLSLIPRIHIQMQGIEAHTCNPSTGEMEIGFLELTDLA